MATQPPKRGGFHDPLHKWDALNRLHEVATTDVLEAVAEVNRIQEALSQPNLSHRERLALANTLIDAKSNLEKAKKASREVVNDLNSTRRLQQQINFRLGTLRSYLANNQNLNLEVTKSLSSTRQALEDLLEESQDLHGSVEKIDDVLKRVEDLDSTLKDLPEDLRDEMKRQTRILADIETQQRNAQDFLNEHEKRVRGMYENSMRWARSKVMSVADQVGFGALNLGNFLRAGGATLGGARSLYQGARYLGRLREARKIVSTSKREAQAKTESTSVNSQSGGVLRSIRDLVRRRADPKTASPSTQTSVPAPVQTTPPAADLPPAPELSPPQEPKPQKPKITTQPADPSVGEERSSFGSSRFLSKTQGQSRDLVEQQEAILSEVKATRREIGQAPRFDDQDREVARDQLDAQQELTSQVTKWVQYTQGYHRRLLARLNKKDSTTEDGLFASLLKGGIGLVSRLIPGIGSAVSGLLGRSLIGRLGGRLISMIWGATRASLGLGGRVIAGAAGLLARAGAAAIAAGASWVTRGSKFILELGSKLIDRLSPGKKITEYGKRAVGLGRAAIGALGHLLLQRSCGFAQAQLGIDLASRLDDGVHHRHHRAALVPHGAIAEGEVPLFLIPVAVDRQGEVLHEGGFTMERALGNRADHRPRLGPHLVKRTPQRLGLEAKDGAERIVVKTGEPLAPHQAFGKVRGQHHLQREPQRRGPSVHGPQWVARPVIAPNLVAHGALRTRKARWPVLW